MATPTISSLVFLLYSILIASAQESNDGGEGCDRKRPKDVRDGLVRFHSVHHGDRARYECNPGYRLFGEQDIICQHGHWTGTVPICYPVYCPYPGTLSGGAILLVGVLGKYEYRPYFRGIGQGEKIEFQCERDHHLVGSPAATCIDGAWTPEEKPTCQLSTHRRAASAFRSLYT